jgi:putative membrane protein
MMGNYYGNGTGTMMNNGAWPWLLMCIGFVFLILIIVGVIFVFFGMIRRRPHSMHKPGESHMDILKRRYAAGEIDKNEFDTRKKDLEG